MAKKKTLDPQKTIQLMMEAQNIWIENNLTEQEGADVHLAQLASSLILGQLEGHKHEELITKMLLDAGLVERLEEPLVEPGFTREYCFCQALDEAMEQYWMNFPNNYS